MDSYKNFINFMKCNKDILHSEELRPKKSITRNIITGVAPFVNYYTKKRISCLSMIDISNEILNIDKVTSTTRDNIRNLEELKFIVKNDSDSLYRFTRNFAEFVNSGLSLEEYILNELKKIKNIDNITMFYNCILCLLLEASEYGFVLRFPDSLNEFKEKVSDKNKRIYYCKKVEEIYGFTSRNNEYGQYTPNANYRFLSTCVTLNLIKKDGTNENGLIKYILTDYGKKTLSIIDSNLSWFKKDNHELDKKIKYETEVEINLYVNECDNDYIKDVNNIPEEMLEEFVDMPQPLANTYGNYSVNRDPKKGANAKKRANYMCECDKSHISFSTNSDSNYVEAHHLIPLSLQNKFVFSLDVEANIIALCSRCHNLLHYGKLIDKKPMLEKLYKERIDRLKNCGIYITLEDLVKVYE